MENHEPIPQSQTHSQIPTRIQAHVLVLPYPSQGHINPMLQFGKRIAAFNLRVTLAVTQSILGQAQREPGVDTVFVAPISDGFDRVGFAEAKSIEEYLNRFESIGSKTLEDLIISERDLNRPIRVLVYDSFLPWAADVGRRHGLVTASFFTQSCAVNIVYMHLWEGRLKLPVRKEAVELPGLPRFEPEDLPSFVSDPVPSPYPAYLAMLMDQFKNLDKADEVLINSFYELEHEEAEWMSSKWRAKTIGPTIPSAYLDGRLSSDTHYGFHLYAPVAAPCMAWLDSRALASVVYVSFGSMAACSPAQMAELAFGLRGAGKPFLWVVRVSEAHKLPEGFAAVIAEEEEKCLIVPWCPQLDVLAHAAVGCFVTHCGWNSTTEGIGVGVPMVGVPQWTDQPTNARYIEGVWGVGVRVRVDAAGVVGREEVEWRVREVMEGERGEEMRRRARTWREKAKAAVGEGGSSDRNIVELVAKYCSER